MKRLVTLLAVTAALAAATSSPAAAGAAPQGIVCAGFEESSTFSALQALHPSTTARTAGKTLDREKDTKGITGDSQIPSGSEPATSASFTATIPVWFHVVHDGKTGKLSRAAVQKQMDVLNLSFAGFYDRDGNVEDSGFRFSLAGVTYTDNAEWFAQETFAAELAMKRALKRGDAKTLNLYSTSGGGFLGWAYYPSIVTLQQYQVLDGVVIHYGSVPGGYITNFNLGFTATHEVGHWLGLPHTFEQGCTGHGDYVDDTPYEATPTSGCPEGKDTCDRGTGVDPIHNYMDYSYDTCYWEFSPGQGDRMQQQYLHWRVKVGYVGS